MGYLHIHFVCDKLFAFVAILFTFPFVFGLKHHYYNFSER